MRGVSGDVIAETTNGDVVVSNSKASSLEVSTVNGDVRFEGPAADKGLYRVTTHNGDIRVSLGAQANATVFVRTFGGDFSSDFPVTLPEGMSNRDGNKRFNFTLGGGSARVELQSFQGDIYVSRGPLPARTAAPHRAGTTPRIRPTTWPGPSPTWWPRHQPRDRQRIATRRSTWMSTWSWRPRRTTPRRSSRWRSPRPRPSPGR